MLAELLVPPELLAPLKPRRFLSFLSIFEIDQPSGFFVGPQEKFGDEGLFNLGEFITYKKEEMLKRILANTEKLMEGQI